jgi:hypothetical protein
MRLMMMTAAAAMLAATFPAVSFAAKATPPYTLNAAGKCIGANKQL